MRVYLANVASWTFPNQGSEMLCQKGFEVGGNWLDPPFQRQLKDFSADVVVYAPHRRVDAVVLHKKDVLRVPTLLFGPSIRTTLLAGTGRRTCIWMASSSLWQISCPTSGDTP